MEILDEYKLFVQRIGLVGITNILVALSSLILLPIMTKNFSVGDYGIWVQINTTISLIPNLATLGLPHSMFRFLSSEVDKKEILEGFYSIATVVLASTFIISTLLFIFSKDIATALFNGNINIAILLILIVFLVCLNTLLLNFFRTFQQMKRYSIFLLIQTYLGLFIVSYFAIEGSNIYIAALGLLIANLVTFFIMTLCIISDIGFKIPNFKNMKKYLSFGLPTLPSDLSYWIVDSSDRYVIGLLLGTAFVGYYSPGYTLGNIITMILAPFSLLLPSLLPEYYDNGKIEKLGIFLKYSMKYFLLIAIPSAFGLSILSKPILTFLTTSEIASNGYLITPFVALSAILGGFYVIISNIIVLKNKTKIVGSVWAVAAILNIILNILIIPYIGILGAAAATLVSYAVTLIITIFYSFKYFKFDLDPIFILKSTVASIVMSAVILSINPYTLLNILITIMIGAAVYMGLLLVFKGIKREELQFFKRMLIKG